jgi:hypothetical protein
MISGTNLDHFNHFLTVFCQQMGSATAQMHHPGCIAAAFRNLNSLCIDLGMICPNKRSYNEVVPGQTADAVGQTLTSHPPFQPNSGKKSEMKWEIESKFDETC